MAARQELAMAGLAVDILDGIMLSVHIGVLAKTAPRSHTQLIGRLDRARAPMALTRAKLHETRGPDRRGCWLAGVARGHEPPAYGRQA